MNGHVFTGEPTLVPNCYQDHKFQYENLYFCSPSCAKGWIFRDMRTHPDRIHLFALYCRQVLRLTEPVPLCPDPRFIDVYMCNPAGGLTIEQYRADSGRSRTGHRHLSPLIDETLCIQPVVPGSERLDVGLYTSERKDVGPGVVTGGGGGGVCDGGTNLDSSGVVTTQL